MFQWASQYIGLSAPGFSNHTIENFRFYLNEMFTSFELKQLFNIEEILSYNLRNRIAESMNLTYNERISADSLINHYISYLEVSNYHAKKRLVQELRDYALDSGKEIVIGANSFALGTNRPAGYWPKGLLFSEILDVFIFENEYTAIENNLIPDFPRNKWLAWEKLARAAIKTGQFFWRRRAIDLVYIRNIIQNILLSYVQKLMQIEDHLLIGIIDPGKNQRTGRIVQKHMIL